ncbi:putative fructokinase-7 [Glycine soja]
MSGSSKHRGRESHKGPLVVCFGEMMINLVPTVARVSLADATAYKKFPSGATANVAVGICRLGGSAAFIGKVGNDEFGHLLSDILKQNGVDNSGLLFDDHARTALGFYALKSNGEPEFMFYRNPSSDVLLRPDEIDMDLIKKATIFHYGSVSLIKEPCRSAHLAAMNAAKVSGCFLSYAPNLALPLWPSKEAARQGIMSVWNYADIIKVSVDEIRLLTEGDDPYDDTVIMKKLHHYNLKLLIVTEGARGCRYYTKMFLIVAQDFKGWVAGFEVEAIDTTGAADSFVGGLLSIVAAHNHIYKDEKRLREALDFANACAAFTVTGRGAIPSLPTKDAVLRIMFSY